MTHHSQINFAWLHSLISLPIFFISWRSRPFKRNFKSQALFISKFSIFLFGFSENLDKIKNLKYRENSLLLPPRYYSYQLLQTIKINYCVINKLSIKMKTVILQYLHFFIKKCSRNELRINFKHFFNKFLSILYSINIILFILYDDIIICDVLKFRKRVLYQLCKLMESKMLFSFYLFFLSAAIDV